MDKRSETIPVSERAGASCAVDRSCCGGGAVGALIDEGCTLDPVEMPERLARWQALFGQMLGYDRRPDHAVFHFAQSAGLDAELRELVKLEQVCCAQVSWDLKVESKQVLLTLKAEPQVLSALVRGFTDEFGGAS